MYPIPSGKRCQTVRSSPSSNIAYLYTRQVPLSFPLKKNRIAEGSLKYVAHFKAVVVAGENPERTVLLIVLQ